MRSTSTFYGLIQQCDRTMLYCVHSVFTGCSIFTSIVNTLLKEGTLIMDKTVMSFIWLTKKAAFEKIR